MVGTLCVNTVPSEAVSERYTWIGGDCGELRKTGKVGGAKPNEMLERARKRNDRNEERGGWTGRVRQGEDRTQRRRENFILGNRFRFTERGGNWGSGLSNVESLDGILFHVDPTFVFVSPMRTTIADAAAVGTTFCRCGLLHNYVL